MNINIETFKEDYLKLTNKELIAKYNIKYNNILKLKKELNLPNKHDIREEPKFYCFDKRANHWKIMRKGIYYGAFRTEDEVKKAVEFLKEHDWNQELFNNTLRRTPKFYYFNKSINEWIIMKKRKFYASTKTEREAKKIVEFLRENNWDKELLKKHMPKKKHKYYHFNTAKQKWVIMRNGVYYFATKKEDEAKKIVEFLKENNWSKKLFQEYKNRILNISE